MSTPVEYAETDLGVHSVYQQALDAQADLDDITTRLDKAQDERRSVVEQIADREAALYGEKHAAHATESATWLKEHMSRFKREDPALKALRAILLDAQSKVGGLEYDLDVRKSQIKILSARMEQLGGYLNYLAAAMNKQAAETATKTHESKEPNGD